MDLFRRGELDVLVRDHGAGGRRGRAEPRSCSFIDGRFASAWPAPPASAASGGERSRPTAFSSRRMTRRQRPAWTPWPLTPTASAGGAGPGAATRRRVAWAFTQSGPAQRCEIASPAEQSDRERAAQARAVAERLPRAGCALLPCYEALAAELRERLAGPPWRGRGAGRRSPTRQPRPRPPGRQPHRWPPNE